jgi:hypothetical protein
VLPRINKEADDSFFAERLGGLQPMQALNEHETPAIRSLAARPVIWIGRAKDHGGKRFWLSDRPVPSQM